MAKSTLKRRSAREALAAYFLLAPDVLGLILIYIVPIIFTIYYSFFSWNGAGKKRFIGIENYRSLFSDPLWFRSMGITFIYVLVYVVLLVCGAILLAVLINKKTKGIQIFRTVYFFPIVMPIIVAAIVWQFIYEPSYGVLNYVLRTLGMEPKAWLGSQDMALISVVIVSVWKQVGYYMILMLAGLNDIPVEYYEASIIDGANGVQRFFKITLPLLKPMIVFILVVSVITGLQDFDQVYVLTRGGPNYATYVQVFYIYEKAFKFLKMGYASASSVVLFIIIMVMSLLQLKLFKGGKVQ